MSTDNAGKTKWARLLRAWRAAKGFTRAVAAARLGASARSVEHWENGRVPSGIVKRLLEKKCADTKKHVDRRCASATLRG